MAGLASWLAKMAWRYRWELIPVWAGLALLCASAEAHAYAARAWPIALPLGAAATVGWRWRTDPGVGRRLGVALGSVITLWIAAAWWGSPWHQSLMVILCAGMIVTSIPWWRHWRRRDRVGHLDGWPAGQQAIRRQLRRLKQQWPARAVAADLGGSSIHHAEADAHGYELTLSLRPGQTVADVVASMARLESALGTRPGAVHVAADQHRADRCHVRVVHTDPLAASRPWNGPTGRSIADPVHLGLFSGGGRVEVGLLGEHALIAGATQRGKSGLANVIAAELVARDDVVLWGIDCTGGLELAPWRTVLDRLATSPGEACELLEAAGRMLDARARLMGERGQPRWRPSATEPALVLLVSEVADLAGDSLASFERLARLGRAPGIGLVAVTRHPSAALGRLDVHAHFRVRVCLGVIQAHEVNTILGPGRLETGWRAERLQLPGSFLILVPGRYETPRPARAFWLSDEAAAEVSARFRDHRPELDPVSAAAADHLSAAGFREAFEESTRHRS